jgi:hypothetical protein
LKSEFIDNITQLPYVEEVRPDFLTAALLPYDFINVISVGLLVRKREFAALESVGKISLVERLREV